ncbi:hypothetical protein UlMin_018175 [Ulmus minor]
MATSLNPNPTFLKMPYPKPKPNVTTTTSYIPIRCGPRDNRGPLVKGRVLSIEAIQAIQTLKRAQRSDPTNLSAAASRTLSRLLKADLIATLKELLRQDQCALALQVFAAVRSEYQPELSIYADLVTALSRNGMTEDIDRLIFDLEKQVVGIQCDDKAMKRFVRAVIGSGSRESTVRIYGLLKSSGWRSGGFLVDDFLVKALSKGLRKHGEVGLADDIDGELGRFEKGNLEKGTV